MKWIVGSDRTGGAQKCLDTVCKILKDGGKDVLNTGVTPNTEGSFRKHAGKEDIGVFIINGICLGTIISCDQMVQSGICSQVIIGIPKPLMGGSTFSNKEALTDESKKLSLVNDGTNWPSSYRKYEHKYTVDGICNALSGISYAWGETCEELGQNILNGAMGTDGSGSMDESASSDDSKKPTPMSYKDMILDLISIWDGDVEAKIKQNKLYINKVPEPKPQLWVVDGVNVISKQAKVKDYNSDTINTLNVSYDEGKHNITITDEYLINRFGEVVAELEAEKVVTDYSGDGSSDSEGAGNGDSANGTAQASKWKDIAGILQKYYDKPDKNAKDGGWNSIIRKILNAKKYDPDIKNTINKLPKKKGYEHKSYVDVGHELCEIMEINF